MRRITIPVQIDNINKDPAYDRARCVYYRIEAEEGTIIRKTRFLLSSSALFAAEIRWAALAGPEQGYQTESILFSTPEQITNTFNRIHANDKLLMELGYIWVPNKMLNKSYPGEQREDISEGSVYRISLPYFLHCYRFVTERISEAEWLNPKKKFIRPVESSPQETEAFRQWRKEQIQISSARYHRPEFAALRLAKKDVDK